MFTVTVSRLPRECTEDEIIAHFGALCPQHKIANVSMAFDNAKEIEECTKRGDLIRAKVRAVHVRSPLPTLKNNFALSCLLHRFPI